MTEFTASKGRMLVSVVIPVFNGEKYLRQAIRSALEQTLPPHEVIVVDDGSTDSSREIASSFGSAVICLSQDHKGASAARNLAAANSTGDWIAYLDADDYWLPGKLARQAAAIQASPDAGLVYTGRTELYPDGTFHEVQARNPRWVKKMLPSGNVLFPTTALVKKSLALENGFDTSLESSVDWWFFYRLSRIAAFEAIPESTAVYRSSPESLCNRNWKAVLHNAETVSRRIQNDFTGLHRTLLRRKANSKLFANAAISARAQGSPEFLLYIVKSLISWPFPDFWPARYRVFLMMIFQKLKRR
jgi:glycosyltransferase involved in cell wall biosynthesis